MPERQFSWANRYLKGKVDWQQMAEGNSSNRLFRGYWQGQVLILRVNAPGDVAFGVDRHKEYRILKLIAGQSWAPDILYNDWENGWCLMKEAGTVTSADHFSDTLQDQLICCVNQWQRLNCFTSSTRTPYQALWNEYRRVYARYSETGPAYAGSDKTSASAYLSLKPLEQLLELSWKRLQLLPELPLCLVHHDLHPGNLCLREGRLKVLDWEYGGFGIGWFDAAALRQQFAIESEKIMEMPVFTGLSTQEVLQGLDMADWLNSSLELLWHSVRCLLHRDGSEVLAERVLRARKLLEDSTGKRSTLDLENI
ncbi:phosphotransferase [Motiliproteus sp. MSK22-1]|uniref:phosphotransferase n=1 Tax=Motiliproteus sp. MSK22-1 TaxID=1897630 RepID=UPI00097862EA|nr:phosphotransferase [Motiliproteus sp. MSK22-1]OMH33798.1 hypothetical protein BGP75_12470 [Motiliproteus sp. MSK22-1]